MLFHFFNDVKLGMQTDFNELTCKDKLLIKLEDYKFRIYLHKFRYDLL